ncbi:MAG: DUF58 domain-containing protein [Caldivirga sp.]
MGEFDDALLLLGRLMPIAFIAFNLGNTPVLIASLALLAINLATWGRGLDLELILLGLAIIGLMQPLIGLALSIPMTLILDSALKVTGNTRPWWVYATALSASALVSAALINPMQALNYAAPLAYVTLTPLATWLALKASRISLTPSRRLETIAGAPLDYGLTLTTRPRIKAMLEFVSNEGLTINPPKLAINGQCTVKVRALYQLGGVRRPRLRVRLIDSRGLVAVERVVRHPPITVIPRLRAAAEYATAMVTRLSPWDVGDVEVKEYAPGDPVRRVHWKKTLKLRRLVIKVLRQEADELNIALVPYASNKEILDRVGEALILTIATALLSSRAVKVYVVDRSTEPLTITPRNLNDAITRLTGTLRNLNIKPVGGLDAWGLLDRIRRDRLTLINGIGDPLIVIGESTWTRSLCRTDSACLLINPRTNTQ